jgi:rhodanese-related sulfurtransferase
MTHTTVSVEDLRERLDHGEPITVLDIRPEAERAEWAIPGSTHIDVYEALKAQDPHALEGIQLRADQPVVTVCGAGKTSLIAAEQLRTKGFEAASLEGGMKAWSLAWNVAEVPVEGSEARVFQLRRTGKG